MSVHNTSQVMNVYRHPLSFRTSTTSVFLRVTHVLIGGYFRRIPSLFVGDGIVIARVATRLIVICVPGVS